MSKPLWSETRMREVAFEGQREFGISAFDAALDMAVQIVAEYEAELAQRAKPDAQGGWQPLNGYIHFSLANGHLTICDARSIDGLPFPDDVAICRYTAPVEAQPVTGDVLDAIFEMRELAAESIPYAGEYFDDKWQLSERFEAKYQIVDAWLKEMGHAAYRDEERPAAEAGA